MRQQLSTTPRVRLRHVVWSAWLIGGLGRLIYLVSVHPATGYVYSDMLGYAERAQAWAAGRPESIADTLYPPGASWLFGALLRLDPSWALVLIGQWVLSLGTLGLVWLIAHRVSGPKPAAVALVVAAVYPPYFHYASLLLAENGFTFFVLASVWLLLCAVDAPAGRATVALGVGAGLAAGLATAFKNTMIAPLLVTGVVLAGYAARRRVAHGWSTLAGVTVGFALVLLPLSLRCTALNEGNPCLSANNMAMNVLMGHYDDRRDFHWTDAERGYEFNFTAVASGQRGYTGEVRLDFGPYDSARNWDLARGWVAAHPGQALGLSIRNVGELFGERTLWPPLRIRNEDLGLWSQVFFWLVVLVPAAARLTSRAPAMARMQATALPEWLLLAPLLGLMLSVFVSITEVRFRVPFDGLLIALASAAWCAVGSRVASAVRSRRRESAQLS